MTQITFQYKAIDRNGSSTKGVLQASDEREAYRQIVSSGLKPLRIKPKAGRGRRRRITLKDLSQLTYQFSVLMEARLPVVEGFRAIAEQESNERLREIMYQVAHAIEGGSTITQALEVHRDVFGDIYIQTIHAAELSGNLIEILNNLASMLDHEYEMRKQAKGALIYPMCVVGALGLAMGFLMVFVVPRFATMFASRGIDLPLPTQMLIWFSSFLRLAWPGLLVGGLMTIWGLRKAWRNPHSRKRIDRWLHHLPFIRDILQGMAISRFVRVFGISLRSGLCVIEALDLAGKASGRPMLEEDAQRMLEHVRLGGRLTEVINLCPYFPPFTRRMLSAGEESAQLSKMCQIISRHYDREVQHLTKNISTMMEPILVVGLAAVVLIVALAIFLPMWDMGALIA